MPNSFSFVKICVEKRVILKKVLKNNWQLLILETLVIAAFVIFCGKFGDLMVDSYREIYISQELLNGKCLYKDIFVIYPPLAYLINALFIKLFGNALNTLQVLGLFSTMGIIFYTYQIAKIFLNKFYPSVICCFLISGLVLSPNVFNAFLPYSYGILYGTFFILSAIFFALKKKYPLSYLFYSLAILCKYEFFLLLPLLIFWSKKIDWKKNLITFFLPILLTLGILLIQGLRFIDFKATAELVGIMSSSKTLYWFYSVMGLTFRFETLLIYIENIVKFLFPISWINYQEILVWAFPVITLGTFFKYRTLSNIERFFIVATILISAKVFFALTLQSYGVYFLPFALISLFILIPNKFKKVFGTLLIIWSIVIGFNNIQSLKNKKSDLDIVVQYIKNNSQVEDTVLNIPECLSINVLSNRKTDTKFYSLIPLYVETFGEELIVKRLTKIEPEFIIINNYDTSAYYFQNFGEDYGQNILKWIEANYKLETTLQDGWEFKVYKKNK